MRISVVTVAFNSARTIRDTVESFLAQTHGDAELLVVDGQSTDGTTEIVRGYGDPRIRLVSEPDAGIYDAMNKGFLHYAGDAIGFLNSDDRFHDGQALARIAAALGANDAVFGNVDFVTDHRRRRVVRRWRSSDFRPGAFRRGWMPPHPTFYVTRALAERTGGFDTGLCIAADYDFMLRALERGPVRAAHVDETLVDMMIGGASTRSWRAVVRGNLEALRSRRRHLGAGALDLAFFAKPLGKLGQLRHRRRT